LFWGRRGRGRGAWRGRRGKGRGRFVSLYSVSRFDVGDFSSIFLILCYINMYTFSGSIFLVTSGIAPILVGLL